MWNNQEGFQAQGGFSSPGGFGTPQADEKRSRQRAQTIVPVTAAEIINSTQQDDKFYSGEIEIYQVSMIGLVRAVKESATRIDYEIDDLTGPPLEVKQFVDNDESVPDEERIQSMRENTYVRVRGTVRSFGGKKSITASKITPVTDMNELTYHILEVVHSHITANAGQTGGGDMGGAVQGMTSMDQGGAGFSDDMVSGLTSIQNQVRMAIKSDGSAEGASVDMVSRQMKGLPEKAIRDAIEFLSSEGHIYSTIDDDHYKATDS
ncbi:replication protein A 32 kDa subunit-B-like [Mya arenaria]|uniref:replication protein A 32 kDa subunit-B-like n=1 Tax=Mya arenaria TaxID=6604 RepID=UPI0022DF87BD|nr:replication protein A 32 kDa subunit-B-like [Mya arenaria]